MKNYAKAAAVVIGGLTSAIVGGLKYADVPTNPPATATDAGTAQEILSAGPISPEVNEVATRLIGVMTAPEQATEGIDIPPLSNTVEETAGRRITTCRIAAAEPYLSSIYLYQEHTLSTQPNSPFRQQIVQILPGTDVQTVELYLYSLKAPNDWVGSCDQPEAVTVALTDVEYELCSASLEENEQSDFTGQLVSCPSDRENTAYETHMITLKESGMEIAELGFNAGSIPIWGSPKSSYRYQKQPP